MICLSGTCKGAGRSPCVNSGDCAYGACAAGLCPFTPNMGFCTSDNDSGQECDGTLTCEGYFTGDGFVCIQF